MKSVFLCCTAPALMVMASGQAGAEELSAERASVDEVVVIGTPASRYYSRAAQAGSRIETDILDVPRSVDSIPEQLLIDQHINELSEIYRYSANVVNNDGYGGTREDYIIRGFRRRDDVYRDGVRLKTNSIVDPSTVASVEILKGPVSDIGQMTPGGLVNIVTKKPSIDAYRRAEVSFDSEGDRRSVIDLTDGFAADRFAYRLTTSYQNGDTFRDESKTKRLFISGGLSWFGADGSTANVTYEHGDDNRPMDRGFITLPISGGAQRYVPDLDRSSRLDAPFARRKSNYDLITVDTAIRLNETWRVEGKLLFNNEKTDEVHTEVRSVATDGTLTRRVEGNVDRDLTTWFGRVQLRGAFELGVPVRLVAGVELRKQSEDWFNFTGANQTFGTVSEPLSDRLVNDSGGAVALSTRTARSVEQEDYGPYVQTDIQLTPALTLTLGGRYEFFGGDSSVVRTATGVVESSMHYKTQGKFTKSGALAWKPQETWTLYTNYSDTFQPHNFYENATELFPSQKGRMIEFGVKKAAFNNTLLLTAAYFDIKQSNVVEVVDGVPELSAGQTSKGFELSAIGSPMRGLNVRAGLGYADAQVVSQDASVDGNRPTNVPKYNANLWASYEVQDKASPLRGLGVGAGAVYVSNRYGDTAHTFEIGSYTLFDASAWYYVPVGGGRQLRVTGGVKNLTNERYYTASGGTYRISVGAPRTVYASIGYQF